MKMYFKKVKHRLMFWFLLITLIPILVIVAFSYHQQVAELKANTYIKLEAIRDLKADQLKRWLEERFGDLTVTALDFDLINLESIIDIEQPAAGEPEKLDNARSILNNYKRNFPDYQEIFIINPETGKIIVSTDRSLEGMDKSTDLLFIEPLKTRKIYFKDFYYSPAINDFALGISIPIFCGEHSGDHVIGILAARLNLEHSFYRILQNRIGLGKTGETLLVNQEGYVLNPLRWQEEARLKLRIRAEPALRAAAGRTGIIETEDYRQELVLAAYNYIENAGWGLVSKQDLSEIKQSLRKQLQDYFLLILISIMVIVIVSTILSRTISKPVTLLKKLANKIEDGDFSVRIEIKNKDEFGSLASSVNEMAKAIDHQLKTQEGIRKINEAMIGRSEIKEFAESLVTELQELTGSVMAGFYQLNEKEKVYEHLYSVGLNQKLAKAFSAAAPEGEFGTAISSGRIYHFKDIPATTAFSYLSVSGELIPKEIITIPILSNTQKVIAILSLASLHKFEEHIQDSINMSWHAINQSYYGLTQGVKTRNLAENLKKSNHKLAAQAEELTVQANELKQQAEELQQNSSELQEQNQELEIQKEQVMQATKIKSEFLANMSHELRTPLNSVLALSEILISRTQEKLSEEELNYLTVIERNGRKLLELINDILDLSKIEAGKIELMPTRFSIKVFLENIHDLITPLADQKNLAVRIELPDPTLEIETDEKRLYQIMHNLTGNAVKFTQKGEVKICAFRAENNLVIQVSDTGIGIPHHKLDEIFEEFRQVDGSTARMYEGTGLGLTISSKLARLMNGEINVESKEGKGSTFSVILPIKWSGPTQLNTFNFINQTSEIKLDNSHEEIKSRLLLVEDNESAIIQVSSILRRKGFLVDIARNGREALEYVKQRIPDGIILDLMMPEIDGFEVLEKIRSSHKTWKIPVLILTAKDLDSNDLSRLSANNVQQLVQKGEIDLKGLLYKINLMLYGTKGTENLPVEDNRNDSPSILAISGKESICKITQAVSLRQFELISAKDGLSGLQKAIQLHPDLIILDINLTQMSGLELLVILKNTDETKDIPVITITAFGDENLDEIYASGSNDNLNEPLEAVKLLETIKKWINKTNTGGTDA